MSAPARLGRYELLSSLGEGGMGAVYVGRLRGEARFERLYAIKTIHDDLATHARFVTMFFDEARTAACIHSPWVVSVLDVGRGPDGAPFMVMELVVGCDLARLLDAGPLPIEQVLSLLRDMARGLRDAHQTTDPYGMPLRVAHRDVSPRNVLVGVDGRARMTDFGLAKARQRSAVSLPGELKGSYPYFSPEHLHGGADAASDLFSFGIIAWEALAGRRLFSGATPAELLDAVAAAPIPPIGTVAPHAPPELADVIGRALQRDRTRRWRTAADIVEALERIPLQPAPPETLGARVREHSEQAIDRIRALDRAGVSEAATLLQELDTLVDPQFDLPTRDVVSDGPNED